VPTGATLNAGRLAHEERTMPARVATDVATIGIDIGKNSFHLVGLDARGAMVMCLKLSRGQIEVKLANLRSCLIGMEACVGAHHLSRRLMALGHDVRLIPARYVKPFVKTHKNDFRDAEAVAEAVQRPTMRFVAPKTVEQLDLQALHRVRSRLVGQRNAVTNQIRAFLLERGIAVRTGLRFLRQQLPDHLSARTDALSPRMGHLIEGLIADWRHLESRIEQVTDEIERLVAADEACRRLMTVPGIGPIVASAIVATIGDGAAFERGRDFGAWLGLVPRQLSTGDRTILGRISKRGNVYLRMLFVQAAKVVLIWPRTWPGHSFGPWLEAAAKRMHRNVLGDGARQQAQPDRLVRLAP
jgi:transposase